MKKWSLFGLLAVALNISLLLFGCVERRLTINTDPQGALVILNDEEIGISPVTVSFEWYGDYWVRLSKEGYDTVDTHYELKGPWYDQFPFDFFAQVLYPKRIVDSYEMTFPLVPKHQPTRETILKDAQALKEQLR